MSNRINIIYYGDIWTYLNLTWNLVLEKASRPTWRWRASRWSLVVAAWTTSPWWRTVSRLRVKLVLVQRMKHNIHTYLKKDCFINICRSLDVHSLKITTNDSGLHKVRYPGNGVTSQTHIWQPIPEWAECQLSQSKHLAATSRKPA